MQSTTTSLILLGILVATVLVGRSARRHVPDNHLGSDSRDAVKLAMGLVATMTALLLGLLVGSAKATFDSQRTEVIQMAAQVAFLDHVLAAYGPEAIDARGQLRDTVAHAVHVMWPDEAGQRGTVLAGGPEGDRTFAAVQALAPRDDAQRSLKAQATTLTLSLGQLRFLLVTQMAPSIPRPLLFAVGWWLVIIFLFFSLLAPPNATTTVALVVAAVSVAGAVFLIMELDQPLGGLIRIPSEPLLKALGHLPK